MSQASVTHRAFGAGSYARSLASARRAWREGRSSAEELGSVARAVMKIKSRVCLKDELLSTAASIDDVINERRRRSCVFVPAMKEP